MIVAGLAKVIEDHFYYPTILVDNMMYRWSSGNLVTKIILPGKRGSIRWKNGKSMVWTDNNAYVHAFTWLKDISKTTQEKAEAKEQQKQEVKVSGVRFSDILEYSFEFLDLNEETPLESKSQ